MSSVDKQPDVWNVTPPSAYVRRHGHGSTLSPSYFDANSGTSGYDWPSPEEHQLRLKKLWQHRDRIQCLHKIYEFKHPTRIEEFLSENQGLLTVLEEAPSKIDMYFGEHARRLGLEYDPESMIYLVIATDLDVIEAQRRMDALDDKWFIGLCSRMNGKLNTLLEYV